MNVPSLFISFNTLFSTTILFSFVCPWSVCLLTLEYFARFSAYVFITNMVGKNFVPTNRLTSSQVTTHEKWQKSIPLICRPLNFGLFMRYIRLCKFTRSWLQLSKKLLTTCLIQNFSFTKHNDRLSALKIPNWYSISRVF